ncbi:MAG: histone deacetylase [Ignavibacteriales bacterium]|nr:histone deacetylase [Ignavibacteriales bacterium]
MGKVGFIYHPDYLNHDTGVGHVERPDRLSFLMKHLLQCDIWHSLHHLRPSPAGDEWISKVHPERYLEMIRERCRAGETVLDMGDTHVCKESFHVADLAAGAVLQAVDQVVTGKLDRAFCALRPPGHHAETAKVMGFCLLNNVAIGARYAQQKHGLQRVAILDWDVHHGNGTQEIFYEDPTVLYISLHQFPFYPGTGAADETGEGKGSGLTLNCPMKAGSTQKEYLQAFKEKILPALHAFQPELLMVSAGFDAHRDDPLANINLTEESFAEMTKIIVDVAEKHSGGRVVSVLEGGYHLEALARSVEAHLKHLT